MALRPRNWERFQHYATRRPPWIKLHRQLLDDPEWNSLPIAAKALAPQMWLLASETEDGSMPAKLDWIAFRLRMSAEDVMVGLRPLLEVGWFWASEDERPALLGAAVTVEEPKALPAPVEVALVRTDTWDQAAQEVFDYWRQRCGKEKAKWNGTRRGTLIRRLKEESGDPEEAIAGLKLAVDGALLDPFYSGENETGSIYYGFENLFVHKGRNRIEKLQGVARNPPKPGNGSGKPASRAERIDAKNAKLIAGAFQRASGGLIE